MSWHEGEGKAARIRVPPPSLIPKGGTRLGRVGQENAAVTTLDLTAQSGVRLPPRVLSASGRRPAPDSTRQRRPSA